MRLTHPADVRDKVLLCLAVPRNPQNIPEVEVRVIINGRSGGISHIPEAEKKVLNFNMGANKIRERKRLRTVTHYRFAEHNHIAVPNALRRGNYGVQRHRNAP